MPETKLTFSVCAYGESPYLHECVESVLDQEANSKVIICTSTPNELIEGVAEEFHLPLFVNTVQEGIALDWNFAIRCAETPYVTIAHQDDVYERAYSAAAIEAFSLARNPIIFFSDYGELRNGEYVINNRLLDVKRMMLKPLLSKKHWGSVFWRRSILRFGSPISCPAVTYCKTTVPDPLFKTGMKGGLDWDAWERLSQLSGEFCYDPQILMFHRIHEDSETSHIIADNTRKNEDLAMLERFWPKPIARAVNHFYSESLKSNER